jgi:Icc-related predicted phosphoesterase
MLITFISDTHNKHNSLKNELISGDIIIHSGDISSFGRKHEIENFLEWFSSLSYKYKIFIAGNHDWGFQNNKGEIQKILNLYQDVIYLEDSMVNVNGIKIYGSPWQPEFCNWAFNLPRNGIELEKVWDKIPADLDILVTHGPAYGYLDQVIGRNEHLGCELLSKRIMEVKPKIHCFGHIHSANGFLDVNGVNFINSSILGESYFYDYLPINVEYSNRVIKRFF